MQVFREGILDLDYLEIEITKVILEAILENIIPVYHGNYLNLEIFVLNAFHLCLKT